MKKIGILILALMMAALLLAGCGKPVGDSSAAAGQGQTAQIDSLKTMGDILALDSENEQSSCYENIIVYAFDLNGAYYRAKASISQDVSDAIWALDYSDERYEEKYNALVAPLEIEEIENLNEQILSQEELDALIGKTGQDLLDDGWYGSGYNLETMEFWMNYGPFVYTVVFDGAVAEADYESFDDEEGIKDLPIKSAEFLMLGDATNIEAE